MQHKDSLLLLANLVREVLTQNIISSEFAVFVSITRKLPSEALLDAKVILLLSRKYKMLFYKIMMVLIVLIEFVYFFAFPQFTYLWALESSISSYVLRNR